MCRQTDDKVHRKIVDKEEVVEEDPMEVWVSISFVGKQCKMR